MTNTNLMGFDEQKSLEELQAAGLPVATAESIGITVKQDSEEARALLKKFNEYFKSFTTGEDCPQCGKGLCGLLGTFQWGLCHGEGFCSNCHYPARAMHYFKDSDGNQMSLSHVVLAYHPSVLESPASLPVGLA